MQAMNEALLLALKKNGLIESDHLLQPLLHYVDLIQSWNRVFNLTTITTPLEMIDLHLIDSLSVAPYLKGKRFLDVGSGAGLPGIPLALLNPQQEWVLLDKNSKKTRFLTQVVAELGLKHVEIIHSRSEDFHPALGFDSILSRALGTLTHFAETTEHLLGAHGRWIAMKGKYPQEELTDLNPRFLAENVVRIEIKERDIERHLVLLQPRHLSALEENKRG